MGTAILIQSAAGQGAIRHIHGCQLYPQKRTLNRAFFTSRFGLQAEWAEHVCPAPHSHFCSAPQLNVNLFSNRQGIIYVNAEVSNGALDFSVTKKKLDRT
jgi:hypothetical protein